MAGLNAKQAQFVAEYIANPNASEAARRAGYSEKTAYSIGQRLLKHVEVKAAIDAGLQRAQETAKLSAERTMQEVARLAYADPRKLFDEAGNLLPIHEMPDDVAATIASIEVETESRRDDPTKLTTTAKVKFWDKPRALDQANRIHGNYRDRVEHTGKDGGPIETKEVSELELARRWALVLHKAVMQAEALANPGKS